MKWACLMVAALLGVGCSVDAGPTRIPVPDARSFELQAYPVLLRDCGFPACHGTLDRFFAVFGPGRRRLDEATPPFAPATAEELELSYGRARSMLARRDSDPLDWVPLLKKPLAPEAGGAAHQGEDVWGRDVYDSAADSGYQDLRAWAGTLQQDAP